MSELPTTHLNLSNQTQYRLNEINKIRNYFTTEIQEREMMSKKLSKYIATFDYFDKTLIVLSATNGGISIISFASRIGAPVGIASANFSLIFSLTTEIINMQFKVTRNKKKKHDKTVMLVC